jgi:hypothetical protein
MDTIVHLDVYQEKPHRFPTGANHDATTGLRQLLA